MTRERAGRVTWRKQHGSGGRAWWTADSRGRHVPQCAPPKTAALMYVSPAFADARGWSFTAASIKGGRRGKDTHEKVAWLGCQLQTKPVLHVGSHHPTTKTRGRRGQSGERICTALSQHTRTEPPSHRLTYRFECLTSSLQVDSRYAHAPGNERANADNCRDNGERGEGAMTSVSTAGHFRGWPPPLLRGASHGGGVNATNDMGGIGRGRKNEGHRNGVMAGAEETDGRQATHNRDAVRLRRGTRRGPETHTKKRRTDASTNSREDFNRLKTGRSTQQHALNRKKHGCSPRRHSNSGRRGGKAAQIQEHQHHLLSLKLHVHP